MSWYHTISEFEEQQYARDNPVTSILEFRELVASVDPLQYKGLYSLILLITVVFDRLNLYGAS